jgi:thiamine biosynthesis lipoprotein ApbE
VTATALAIADGRALGGGYRLIVTRPSGVDAAQAALEAHLQAIDIAASRFRDDSELSLLNAQAGREVRVGGLLGRAIQEALRGARISDGAVDPTVGQAVRISGYDADFAAVAPDGPALQITVERVPGWRAVQFDESSRTVIVPRGVELDLGATAKALAADLGARVALEAAGGGGVLVSLGGDIAVAGEAPPGGWPVQVSEDSAAPIRAGEETIAITAGGLATSSTTVRRWTRGGAELHHIIDPETGRPAAGPWRTATVAAATCVDANIASTAAIVKGDGAVAWLLAQGLAARLVDRAGAVHRVGGWPVPQRPTRRFSANTQETRARFKA